MINKIKKTRKRMAKVQRRFYEVKLKRKPKPKYNSIEYSEPLTPQQNSEKLIEFTAEGNNWIRTRTSSVNQHVGTFLSIIMLLELKLDHLLVDFDPKIQRKTFGGKIRVLKEFLNEFQFNQFDEMKTDYLALLKPLNELLKVRNDFAHDITVTNVSLVDFVQTSAYVEREEPHKYEMLVEGAPNEQDKVLLLVSIFCLSASVEIAKLRLLLK
ncbi:hypothetical protein AB6C81_14695 [Vibrio splendidus]